MKRESVTRNDPDSVYDPEKLYRRYRKERTAFKPEESNVSTISESLSAEVYSTYRKTRKSDRDEIIDSIVATVQAANEIPVVGAEKQSVEKRVTGEIKTTSALNTLFNAPARLFNRFTGSQDKKSQLLIYIIPVVAAGVLALFIVPGLIKTPEVGFEIPDSLVTHATAVVPYIESNSSSPLGFSDGASPAKKAFNRGLASSSLSIVANAMQPGTISSIGRQLVAMAVDENQNTLADTAGEYLVGASVDSISETGFKRQVSDIQSLLAEVPEQTGTMVWFRQGQAIEAIVLAGEYARQTQDIGPLVDAIEMIKRVELPDSAESTQTLIEKLRAVSTNSDLPLSEIRQILKTARNVKILMQ